MRYRAVGTLPPPHIAPPRAPTMTATRLSVPMLDLQAQYAPLRDEIRAAVEEVFDTCRFIGGPEVTGLERELADYVGAAHGVGVSSGTDALLVALTALGVGPGDEVVTVPYTFFATNGAVARLGARCRFVDIDPRTYDMDVSCVEDAITERTKAIVPVHLFGQTVDMAPLVEIAEARGVPVVEDAAQAIGARDADGRAAGSIGRVGCFSFFPSKNLGAAGDGGMCTTSDEALAHRMAIMRNHGMEPAYHHELVGGNFRLDAIQAAVLRIKLRHLDDWAQARRRNAAEYRALFAEAGLVGLVTLPWERPGVHHIYNQFVIRVDAARRDPLLAHLKAHEIGHAVYYPKPAHLQPCFAHYGHREGEFPESEAAARQTLAIPIYGELTDDHRRAVVDAIAGFLKP